MASNNEAVLLIGSNIDPKKNVKKCVDLLSKLVEIKKASRVWRTEAVGSDGPDFLNASVLIKTSLNAESIRNNLINPIETKLNRIRTADKYAPRTIDLDLIIFNGEVLDKDVWNKLFVALPVSEIIPDLKPESGEKNLLRIVDELKTSAKADLVEDFLIQD